jgi:hypothetical protein
VTLDPLRALLGTEPVSVAALLGCAAIGALPGLVLLAARAAGRGGS